MVLFFYIYYYNNVLLVILYFGRMKKCSLFAFKSKVSFYETEKYIRI